MRADPPGTDGPAPMGPTRLLLSKPVIAAVEGHAVAGGLELALWCDLRVADPDAVFGVFCRRWGVPLIDGGTVRLPRLIGQSHALDLILTGRPVGADEALRIGLANRVSAPGAGARRGDGPGRADRGVPADLHAQDRLSSYEQHGLPLDRALDVEWVHGGRSLLEAIAGAGRFRRRRRPRRRLLTPRSRTVAREVARFADEGAQSRTRAGFGLEHRDFVPF